MKRTYQPKKKKRLRKHGYLARSEKILQARRRKGRWQLSVKKTLKYIS
ncbi:50S ribosomal protein L34 [endosymbiont DhMRE of Dentiscutata heterogama]|nr:50S ribosomal protein L34 [endosymbiont DhMRE of Dentiscutata heterogama]